MRTAWALSLVLTAGCSDDAQTSTASTGPDAGDESGAQGSTDSSAGATPETQGSGGTEGDSGSGGDDGSDSATGGSSDDEFPGYPIPEGPDPALPTDGQLRILIWRASEYPGTFNAAPLAEAMQDLILAHPDFDDVTVVSDLVVPVEPDQSGSWLLDHYYGWTDREERLDLLDDGWDYVVIHDRHGSINYSAELYFAAVSHLADEIRAHGATPILYSEIDPMPAPDDNGQLCTNTCGGSQCEDGGADSVTRECTYGTDCNRCGPRDPGDAPNEGPVPLLWRVAVGTGCVLVHHRGGTWVRETATAITTALFGDLLTVMPDGLPPGWEGNAADAYERFVADHNTVHYTGPAQTVVRVSHEIPSSVYRFMIAGTSSEAGYRNAMMALLEREGVASDNVSLGSCDSTKHVTAECGDAAAGYLLEDVYQTLYARGYDIPGSYVTNAGDAPEFMAQIYDRHYDGTDDAGVLALNTIYYQTYRTVYPALEQDLAWLPMRVSFGDLKIAFPEAPLLSDGVHATDTVQAGLAAMSYVSRTGKSPTLDGLDPETKFAIENGERLVRTMATLTRTGMPIADTPHNRVVVATP